MLYLDLDELPRLFEGRWLWSVNRRNIAEFRRSDYLGDPTRPLKDCVLDEVEKATAERPRGAVRLLTHLRYFGHCFNPVSFYYCFDVEGAGERLHSIVAEITNTPWKERHRYVLALRDGEQGLPCLAVPAARARLPLALRHAGRVPAGAHGLARKRRQGLRRHAQPAPRTADRGQSGALPAAAPGDDPQGGLGHPLAGLVDLVQT
jgi:hypothetical protein